MKKITPFLWFDTEAEEAMNYYISILPEDSEITGMQKGPDGKLFGGSFKLNGFDFMVLNAGPQFKFNPSISFTIECKAAEDVEELYNKLIEGGTALMPLDKYPFSEKYGWVNDKYGLSWQIMVGKEDKKITPSMLFTQEQNGRVQEALDFYTSLFPNSKIEMVMKYEKGEGDTVGNIKYSKFVLDGTTLSAMESGLDHKFTFNEAVSIYVNCKDQDEVDYFWEKMTADGGEESMCGWLKDKFGVSWQIIPEALNECLGNPDPEKAGKAMQAMLKMKKIIVKDLEDAVA